MPTVAAEIELPCPPAQAWPLVSDPDRLTDWIGGLHAVRYGRLPPVEAGRSFVLDHTVGGQRSRHPADVVAWEPDHRWTWAVLQDQLDVQRTTELSSTPTGTRVRLTLELRPCTAVAWLGMPLFLAEARRRLRADAARLRDQFGR
ncbi:MAG: SRPBCC family protein [Alphaproteobacteria bacterium]|nr:SRPBCC family protein [Alphaproteobacteria bacterium]